MIVKKEKTVKFQIKKNKFFLLKNDLTILDIARHVKKHAFLETQINSLQTMISNMINGNKYHPDLARQVRVLYPELKFKMPAQKKKT
jgi:hypothetical protein